MQIEQGILLPTSLVPFGEGVTGAQSGLVYVKGRSERCVVKKADPVNIAAECFCALLGDHLQLPMLAPIVIIDPRDQAHWFGAKAENFPSLAARLLDRENPTKAQFEALSLVLNSWRKIGAAISFDQLIENGDRNPGNILWNGIDFILIDHERSLRCESMDINKLAHFAIHNLGKELVHGLQSGVMGTALTQQAQININSAIWEKIKLEFCKFPDIINPYFSKFHEIIKENELIFVTGAGNAVTPLFLGV